MAGMNAIALWNVFEKIFIALGVVTFCVIAMILLFMAYLWIATSIEYFIEDRKNRKKGNLNVTVDTSKWKK